MLVVCAGKGTSTLPCTYVTPVLRTRIAGDIHVWDRESGSLLHHVRAQALGGDLTCIAWNPVADPFMFATGSHDGGVRIWTSPPNIIIDRDNASSLAGRSRPPSGIVTPRSADSMSIMPGFQLDVDYKTESPTAVQQEFNLGGQSATVRANEDNANANGGAGLGMELMPPPMSTRSIAFEAPPEGMKRSEGGPAW